MQRWNVVSLAGGIHISLNQRRDMCIPCFFVLLLKEISSISSNTTSNTTRVKTGIKQHAKLECCGTRRGIHISLNRRRDMCIPCFLFSCWWKYRRYHLTQPVTQRGLRQESNNMQRWKIVALAGGGTHITEPAQGYVFPVFIFGLFELSLADWNFVSHTYLTRLVTSQVAQAHYESPEQHYPT